MDLEALRECILCPRNCGANRFSEHLGYCNSDAGMNICAITLHHGEEPVLCGKKGICNVFFSGCNMQCKYCQNYQISCLKSPVKSQYNSLDNIINKIDEILDKSEYMLGFVTPSHCIPQMLDIIKKLRKVKLFPKIIYNTASYDKSDTIKEIASYVDIFLPDYKYAHPEIAKKYSDAYDYPEIALAALKEMIKAKGIHLSVDRNGLAQNGVIIRHLVLPGHIENSIQVLRSIAENLSTKIHIALMAQYSPAHEVAAFSNLQRTLKMNEYQKVIDVMYQLGFNNGWIQDLDSAGNYLPDFNKVIQFD
ncbi:radical SAM protein [candidate division KSB1 bacterium]